MGIIVKSAFIGTLTVAPYGDLCAQIPFQLVLLFGCNAQRTCLSNARTQHELGARGEQGVLGEEQPQEFVGVGLEQLGITGLQCLLHEPVDFAAPLGECLSDYVDKVVTEVVVAAELLVAGSFYEEPGGTVDVLGLIIGLHIRPGGNLPDIVARTGTEHRLVRSLLG